MSILTRRYIIKLFERRALWQNKKKVENVWICGFLVFLLRGSIIVKTLSKATPKIFDELHHLSDVLNGGFFYNPMAQIHDMGSGFDACHDGLDGRF